MPGRAPQHPRVEYPREWPVYSAEAISRATELIERGRTFDYGRGEELTELEESMAALVPDRHVLSVNSGTSALLAAYYALDIGLGDEVLVPDLTFLATASPLFLLGAVPVLCDSGDESGNVTVETLADRLTPRTVAVVVTHLFGNSADLKPIRDWCDRHGLLLVEDCSHAHGSVYRSVPVGAYGDAAVFSLGGVKAVSGGMAGAVVFSDETHFDLACLLSSFRQRPRKSVRDPVLRRLQDFGLGANLRATPVAAVLASSHLSTLPSLVETKRRQGGQLVTAAMEIPAIAGCAISPYGSMGGWYDIVLRLDEHETPARRDEIVQALNDNGVRARTPTTAPLARTSVYRGQRPPTWHRFPPGSDWLLAAAKHRNDLAGWLHDRWISLPATFLNVADDTFVQSLENAIHRVAEQFAGAARGASGKRTLHLIAPGSARSWAEHFTRGDVVFTGEDPATPLPEQVHYIGSGVPVDLHSSHATLERDLRWAKELRGMGVAAHAQSAVGVRSALHKPVMKHLMDAHCVPTARWWRSGQVVTGCCPVVVKRADGTQAEGAFVAPPGTRVPEKMFAEEYVDGIEYSVVFLRDGDREVLLPPVRKAATSPSLTPPWHRLRLCPDPWLTCTLADALFEVTAQAVRACEAVGLGEIEMLVPADGCPLVLEINPRVAGTMRLAAMITKLPVFDLRSMPEVGSRPPAQKFGCEVPYSGEAITAPELETFATSRLSLAANSYEALYQRLSDLQPTCAPLEPDDLSLLREAAALHRYPLVRA